MSKVRYVLGACAVALVLTGCTTTDQGGYTTSGYGYGSGYGSGSDYSRTHHSYYCSGGVCYYTDGASFTNPDGTHVISQSGMVPN